ncbi:exo-alpha-sialidase [Actinoplanes sp. LDG1-06]|uniref:exo-alpha-sialidase n=1 Tax=Paractinoplanes ovalisporus TaxID=2810368 RepID=A0ABS2A2Y7_9ACTN|nr:sialidase family protein [Actinoplanes ovalisporus]MBM2614204.1 exo-alpha-sialidase [Actinoplanes ovalisporus]
MHRRWSRGITAVALAITPAVAALGPPAPASAAPPGPVSAALPGPASAPPPGPPWPVSGDSPYASGCRDETPGTTFLGAEVEPSLDVDPRNSRHLVAAWQQDRRSNGGAQGIGIAVSRDGGRSWRPAAAPTFTQCMGGDATNGGDYERTSNPWVSFGPDGLVYLIALATNPVDGDSVMLASTSTDGGATWGPVRTLIDDDDPAVLNDKPAITADPRRAGHAYAVWDRLSGEGTEADPSFGPTYFTRTTDGGRTWSKAVPILDPGPNAQTIASVVEVLGDGTLVLVTDVITPDGVGHITAMRSTDGGVTWQPQREIGTLTFKTVSDPASGVRIRTADYLLSTAADPRRGHRELYVAWQDASFSGGTLSQIVVSASRDGGLTWSAPARLSAADKQAFLPQLAVNDHGLPLLTYLDFSDDDTATPELETTIWTRYRLFNGRWTPAHALSAPRIDMRQAPAVPGRFIGDYYGLVHLGARFGLAIPVPGLRAGDQGDVVYRPVP